MDSPSKVDVKRQDVEERPLKSQVKSNLQDMNFLEKLKYIKQNITVEPVLALFVMPSVLAMLATQNLNLDKACRVNLEFSDDVCTALRLRRRANHTYEEEEVQKLIASVLAWKSVIHTAIPTILMLFIGAWSDKTGKRKICMLMPIFGEFMTCMLNIINTYFFYQVPVEWTVFMEVVFPALTGGWYTMFLGTFSYLGDITSKETRTFRIGILNLCMTVGFPIGMGLSGVLLKILGFYGVFAISALLQFINFCYVLFFIEDHTWLENKDKVKKTGFTGFLAEFFDINSLKETLEIAFKKGPNNRRLRICLILTVVCLTFGPMWDSIETAKKKLKLAEVTSDLQTEEETDVDNPRPKRSIRKKRFLSSDDEDNDKHIRPPALRKQFVDALQDIYKPVVSSQLPKGPSMQEPDQGFDKAHSSTPKYARETSDSLDISALPILSSSILQRELSVMYIFTRYRFNWDEVKYSIYSTYNLITHSIGTLFSISVFSRKLKADDAVLGMISTASKICGAVVLVFARNDYEVYMSPLLEILNGTSTIALRSIASKLVSYQELGKVYSLFGVAETMMPLVFAPLYSRVYIATLRVLPGAVFLLSILATLPALGIFAWFYHQHKKDNRDKRLNQPSPEQPDVCPVVS